MKVLVGRMQQEAEVELVKYKQSQELEQLESRRYQLQMAQANQVKESTLGRTNIDQVQHSMVSWLGLMGDGGRQSTHTHNSPWHCKLRSDSAHARILI